MPYRAAGIYIDKELAFFTGTHVTEPTADNRPLWTDEIFVFHARDDSGNPIAGNANMGHDYGNAALQPEDRMALIEYMKAIGGHREGSKIVP